MGAELAHSHDWYERRQPGLGGEFLDELHRVLEQIAANPACYGFVQDGIRVGLLTRFPFAVFYRLLPDRIRVLAIFHTARDSSGWQSRT
ncbi:MAG: type II toxin-antitoxin system RelE/ParE family toxin [Planctomycetaceae bacterium]